MRAAVDVMGGDKAPAAILKGCWEAAPLLDEDDLVYLIGCADTIAKGLAESGLSLQERKRYEVIATTEVIDEHRPTRFPLSINCRNTAEIALQTAILSSRALEESLPVSGPQPEYVEFADESDQRAKAMKVLRTRLYEAERERLASERSGARKSMVGSGDRSERIRTYNFPQGRVTDHRINLTLHRLPEILEGQLDELLDALIREDEAERLASLDESA